jgi:hypothetical protein
LAKLTGSTLFVSCASRRSAFLVCAIGLAACGSSNDHPVVVEVSTVVDGAADGKGGALGNADLDSSLVDSDPYEASRGSSDGPESSGHDATSAFEASDAASAFDAQPTSDAPHIAPPPSDGPVDTGKPDAHDAGCAPGCDVGCLTVHDNGLGGTFTDCTALGTYDSTQANVAARSAANVPGDYFVQLMCGFGPDTSTSVCKAGPTNCACWAYAATGTFAPNVGHATNDTVIANCHCPGTLDPTWN